MKDARSRWQNFINRWNVQGTVAKAVPVRDRRHLAAHTREFWNATISACRQPFRVEELTEKVHSVLAITALHCTTERRRGEKNAARMDEAMGNRYKPY